MVSDTVTVGGDIPLRDRQYEIKVRPSLDGTALIGFAGDQHHGARILSSATESPAGYQTLGALVAEHLQYPSVDLAYGYTDENGAHLFRIAQGQAQQLTAFHIGNSEAFDHFQRVRHAQKRSKFSYREAPSRFLSPFISPRLRCFGFSSSAKNVMWAAGLSHTF